MDYYTSVYEDESNIENVENVENDSDEKPVFYTSARRKVYGGGGITPDIKIKHGTITKQTTELIFKRLFFEFGSQYASNHNDLKNNFTFFRDHFIIDKEILQNFKTFIESKDIVFKDNDFKKDLTYIKLMIKAEIARTLWGSQYYYQIRILGDNQVRKSLEHFKKAAKITGLSWNSEK